MAEVTSVLVEDDPEIRDLVEGLLAREGFRVTAVGDGAAMDRAMARVTPDLVILDVMLPGEDGLSICRRLRANTSIPLLMLTAKGDDVDRIVGFEMGADDYLPKPFNPRELVARIRAVLRRATAPAVSGPGARRLVFADWIVDLDAREVRRNGGEMLKLTSAVFDLLAAFVTHPQRVLNRDSLDNIGTAQPGWWRPASPRPSRGPARYGRCDHAGGCSERRPNSDAGSVSF